MKTIKFKDYNFVAFEYKYKNNKRAIALVKYSNEFTKDSCLKHIEYYLSVNMGSKNLNPNCFWLKYFCENKEISDFLFKEKYLIKKGLLKITNYNNQLFVVNEVEMTEKFKECFINFKKGS